MPANFPAISARNELMLVLGFRSALNNMDRTWSLFSLMTPMNFSYEGLCGTIARSKRFVLGGIGMEGAGIEGAGIEGAGIEGAGIERVVRGGGIGALVPM